MKLEAGHHHFQIDIWFKHNRSDTQIMYKETYCEVDWSI